MQGENVRKDCAIAQSFLIGQYNTGRRGRMINVNFTKQDIDGKMK